MKVLVVGGGGREHAICWKLAQSPKVDKLYCAPGNAGIEQVAECVNVGAEDIEGICALAAEKAIDLAVIGPEVPRRPWVSPMSWRKPGNKGVRPQQEVLSAGGQQVIYQSFPRQTRHPYCRLQGVYR